MTDETSQIRELILKARAGDDAARERLFNCCRNYVNVVARTQVESWMRRKVDASDLVQQTMLEAYQAFDQFEGEQEAEWLGWLRKILSHNTQDFIRRYRTAKREANREVHLESTRDDNNKPVDLQGDVGTPSQFLMKHEAQIRVADAIAQLSPDHQEVIHLRNLQRLPFEEVAERMGRTRPAVQMLWFRALKKIQEILGTDEDLSEP